MRAPIRHVGFTLLEMVVTLAASAIVLTLVVGSVLAQQEAFKGGQRVREAQAAARTAMLLVERKVAMAGYGLDPVLAFDFSGPPAKASATAWYTGDGLVVDGSLCPDAAAPCTKDRTDGSDELVFHARDPAYWADPNDASSIGGHAWAVSALDPLAPSVTLEARRGDVFLQGQILLLVCEQAAGYRLATVAEATGEGLGTTAAPLADSKKLGIKLMTEDDLENPFRRQSAGDCAPTRAFLVDRYRFHVRPVRENGRWESYLVLDRGLDLSGPAGTRDGSVDEHDEAIVAPGVEVLQVAYEFTPVVTAASDDTLLAVGRPPDPTIPPLPITIRPLGTPADRAPNAITRTAFASTAQVDATYYRRVTFSEFGFNPLADQRKTNHQANVSAVHIAVVARAAGAPPPDTRGTLVPGTGNTVFNLDRTPAWIAEAAKDGYDGHDRIRLETTLDLPNMRSRRLLYQ
jgi:type IV pilus assembly protein PilW